MWVDCDLFDLTVVDLVGRVEVFGFADLLDLFFLLFADDSFDTLRLVSVNWVSEPVCR
jgi:hypothetical protein